MIRDYLRAKVVKLLSRVILLVNGAIDAIYIMYNGAIEKKEGAGDLLPSEKKVTRSLCMVCFLAQMKLKDERDELVDYSPRDITSKSKQTEALEVVAEADPFEPHHCHPCRRTDDQQATTRDGTVSEEDPEGAV